MTRTCRHNSNTATTTNLSSILCLENICVVDEKLNPAFLTQAMAPLSELEL